MLSQLKDSLKCLECGANLDYFSGETAKCSQGHAFPIKNGTAFFLSESEKPKENNNSLTLKLKLFLKKYPKLFFFFYDTLGVFTGKKGKEAIKNIPRGKLIIDVASGIKTLRDDVIKVDIVPFAGVRIVANAARLPFKDNSCDAVVCESSLEHFKNPQESIMEFHRILKHGGLVYISVPFIVGFHASPYDYYRWTEEGVKELMKDFAPAEIGIGWGPTYALTTILREWLAIVLSFNIELLYQFLSISFMVIFAPLNFLDYIFSRYKSSKNIAYGFYCIGSKK